MGRGIAFETLVRGSVLGLGRRIMEPAVGHGLPFPVPVPPSPPVYTPPELEVAPPHLRERIANSRDAAEWETIVERVFEVFEAAGLTPYPELVPSTSTSSTWASSLAQSLAAGNPTPTSRPEEYVAPQEFLAINCHNTQVGYWEAQKGIDDFAYKMGWSHQIASDAARVGCGSFRRFNDPDLSWYELFDKEEIPDPATIFSRIVADDFAVCSKFTLMAIFCALRGMRLLPTLFTYGGGSEAAKVPRGLGALDRAWQFFLPAHLYYTHLLYPSREGWAEIYWNHTPADVPAQYFDVQKYALILNVPEGSPSKEYAQECARRKSLALLAFSSGIAEYLSALQRALAACNADGGLMNLDVRFPALNELVPYVTPGNEMDHFWCVEPDVKGFETASPDAALEMGLFHALLATPITQIMVRTRGGVGIGLAELTSIEGTSPDPGREAMQYEWLSRVFSWGLPVAFDRLRWYSAGVLSYLREVVRCVDPSEVYAGAETRGDLEVFGEEIQAWSRSCSAVGYTWPVGGPRPEAGFLGSWEDLVQLVGLHWYHFWYAWSEWDGSSLLEDEDLNLLREETRMSADIRSFLFVTSRHVSRWWISEIGFPAEHPWISTQKQNEEDPIRWNPEASELLQASILARRILYLRSLPSPPLMVAWWTSFGGIVGQGKEKDWWLQFCGMGIRNDCALPDSNSGGKVEDFSQAYDAWPRAAWHTMRRIAWLLAHVRSAEILFEDATLLAVVLKLGGQFHDPGVYSRRRYSHMIVAWIDHSTPASAMRVSVGYKEGRAPQRISLVPELTSLVWKPAPPLDGNGYPIGGEVDWNWAGWDPGHFTIGRGRATWELTSPGTPSAPFCLLLDAEDSAEAEVEVT